MRRLRSSVRPRHLAEPLEQLRQASFRTETVVRAFYALPLFWFATHLDGLRPLLTPPHLEPQWPVVWLRWIDPALGAPVILALGLGSAAAGSLFASHRLVRGAVFVGLLQVLALQYSFGKIHHLMHGFLYTSFIFWVFLPDGAFRPAAASRAERQHSLLAISAAQTMLGLTYSLAGTGKLLGSIYQVAQGQLTTLHPSALAQHIADRLLQTYPESVLGPWMIAHGLYLWPMMLGTLYLQLFAVVAALRPHLHRPWGFGLMGFHVMTGLTMTIDFSPNLLLLGLLFIASPTAPPSTSLPRVLRDLPLVGWLVPKPDEGR